MRERVQILAQNPWKCGRQHKKKVITFEKVIVWQFDRFCIRGLLSGSLLTSIAAMPTPPPPPQWRASLHCAVAFLFVHEIKFLRSQYYWDRWEILRFIQPVLRSCEAAHSVSTALLFSTQPQPSVNSSTNPLLSTLSGSFNFDTVITVIQRLQGARGFVWLYKCYKYVCTRAALHQAEDYAGTKKYYFVIVTFSLIFPPVPPL